MPSSVGRTAAPMRLKFSDVVKIRSDSFTFSSAASLIMVFPSANAAMTAIIGISSIKAGIRLPLIVVLCRSLDLTSRSHTGSPDTVRLF